MKIYKRSAKSRRPLDLLGAFRGTFTSLPHEKTPSSAWTFAGPDPEHPGATWSSQASTEEEHFEYMFTFQTEL